MARTGSALNYAEAMVAECNKHQMKPVCDHPSYCKRDSKALYIGQAGFIGYGACPRVAQREGCLRVRVPQRRTGEDAGIKNANR